MFRPLGKGLLTDKAQRGVTTHGQVDPKAKADPKAHVDNKRQPPNEAEFDALDVIKPVAQKQTIYHITFIKNMKTILVVGSTGNISISAVIGALRSQCIALAIVRNEVSAKKLYEHVGTRDGITIVEADIISEHGVQSAVDEVKAGKLPAFQHVYAAGI